MVAACTGRCACAASSAVCMVLLSSSAWPCSHAKKHTHAHMRTQRGWAKRDVTWQQAGRGMKGAQGTAQPRVTHSAPPSTEAILEKA